MTKENDLIADYLDDIFDLTVVTGTLEEDWDLKTPVMDEIELMVLQFECAMVGE